MKKLLLIPFILLTTFSFGQRIDTLLSIQNGHSGKPLFDTAVTIGGTYLMTPTSTKLDFDSSKVLTDIVLNGTGDSIYVFKGGIKVGVIKLGTGGGGSSPWTVSGSSIYYNAGNVGINTTSPKVPLHVNAIMSVGDSVTTSNSIRQFNIIGSNAVASVHRISSNINVAAPSLELLHSTPGSASLDANWDIYTDSIGMSFRDRLIAVGGLPDSTRLTINKATGNISVGIDRTDYPSSILSLNSTKKGFLSPRMTTTQKNAITSPTEGLEVYDNTLHQKSFYNGTGWISGGPYWDNTNSRMGIGTSSPAYAIDILSAANGAVRINATTSSTGTAAQVLYQLANSSGNSLQLGFTSTGYTPSGLTTAGMGFLQVNQGPLLIKTNGAGNDIIFGVNITVEAARIKASGSFVFPATNTATGITGAQTINKISGTVNIAAAGTSVVVTNSLVTTASIVYAVVRTNDATAYIKNVVPAAGSFTINLGAAATAETSIGFWVIN